MNKYSSAHPLLLGVISSQHACRLVVGRVAVTCRSRCHLIISQEFSRRWTVVLRKANLSLLSSPRFHSEGALGPCYVVQT